MTDSSALLSAGHGYIFVTIAFVLQIIFGGSQSFVEPSTILNTGADIPEGPTAPSRNAIILTWLAGDYLIDWSQVARFDESGFLFTYTSFIIRVLAFRGVTAQHPGLTTALKEECSEGDQNQVTTYVGHSQFHSDPVYFIGGRSLALKRWTISVNRTWSGVAWKDGHSEAYWAPESGCERKVDDFCEWYRGYIAVVANEGGTGARIRT